MRIIISLLALALLVSCAASPTAPSVDTNVKAVALVTNTNTAVSPTFPLSARGTWTNCFWDTNVGYMRSNTITLLVSDTNLSWSLIQYSNITPFWEHSRNYIPTSNLSVNANLVSLTSETYAWAPEPYYVTNSNGCHDFMLFSNFGSEGLMVFEGQRDCELTREEALTRYNNLTNRDLTVSNYRK